MGTHIVMSHPSNRKVLVEKVGGEKNFLGVYSAVALAIGGPLVYYCILKEREGEKEYESGIENMGGQERERGRGKSTYH